MSEITPGFIYCITRLTMLNKFLCMIFIFSSIALICFIIFTIISKYCENDYQVSTSIKGIKISLPVFLASAVLSILSPNTKEACAIYIVPGIVNNEKIREVGNEFYDLALDWMKELHPKKVSKDVQHDRVMDPKVK